jgi:hypothetical protein
VIVIRRLGQVVELVDLPGTCASFLDSEVCILLLAKLPTFYWVSARFVNTEDVATFPNLKAASHVDFIIIESLLWDVDIVDDVERVIQLGYDRTFPPRLRNYKCDEISVAFARGVVEESDSEFIADSEWRIADDDSFVSVIRKFEEILFGNFRFLWIEIQTDRMIRKVL